MAMPKPRTVAPAQWVEDRQACRAWRDWRRFGSRSRDTLIPAKAGIQVLPKLLRFEASALSYRVDSRFRGNDRAGEADFLQVASPLRPSFPIRRSGSKARAGCPCHMALLLISGVAWPSRLWCRKHRQECLCHGAWPSWPCCESRDLRAAP
jgi:hypothetical protein